MGETELRVAAKAIDGLIDRVRELEAENERLKAEVERLRRELVDENHNGFIPRLELLQEVERLKAENEELTKELNDLAEYHGYTRVKEGE